ncbi:uncharacterized protein LOC106876724 isoform X2 [Octopus bimaculoides]|uniref:uncharacterized protein LOC106876724 isoform X2 n=1 Tax=Octopus bimaculoides TaxID=37653 RepID=UPI00071C99C7|nr:uncharacterized protein LOC106876724 isoform X2 [Octopus bimaculoides]|eukprot:XP_014780883.1 PREDICTED: uncharacterized protein LOC106876724 isoform X2 [Octopus bimaculoides]
MFQSGSLNEMTGKEQLQKEYMLMQRKLKDADSKKLKLCDIIKNLDTSYQRSKGSVMRYNQLKNIIKATIDDKNILFLQECVKRESHEGSQRSSSITGGLLQRCAEFAGKSSEIADKNVQINAITFIPTEVKKLDKTMLKNGIEDTRNILSNYQKAFRNMKHIIERLKKDYEASKQYPPNTRYNELKRMIKDTVAASEKQWV